MPKSRPTVITMSEARASFAKVLTRAERGEAVQVTRGGKPVAVIVSIEEYREGGREPAAISEAFQSFMKTLNHRALRGADPWADARDRSAGRKFSW